MDNGLSAALTRDGLLALLDKFSDDDLLRLGMFLDSALEPDRLAVRLGDKERIAQKLKGPYSDYYLAGAGFEKLAEQYVLVLRLEWQKQFPPEEGGHQNRRAISELIVNEYGRLDTRSQAELSHVVRAGVIPAFGHKL